MKMARSAPVGTELSAPFWEAAAQHRLVVPRSNTSGEYFFPPERLCPGTQSSDWSYVDSCGTGTVVSFSVVSRPPSPDFDSPYVLAVVDIDEGWTIMTNIIDCEPEAVSIGMRVQVRFFDCSDGSALPMFGPVRQPSGGQTDLGDR